MHKYRSWLLGFGIGLMIGASMLQLISTSMKPTIIVDEATVTRVQLEDEARKAGLVLLTTDQYEEEILKAVEAAREEQPSQSTISPEQSMDPAEASPADSEASEENPVKELYVSYGLTLIDVADMLKELGIIEDANEFVKDAWSISKKLKVGTSLLTADMTHEQIMEELIADKQY